MSELSGNAFSRTVRIGEKNLEGFLAMPEDAGALVIFAHGSGSSRLSPRNNAVAEKLRQAGLATLLFDLLTSAEAADRANVFDIELLGARVAEAVAWARREPATSALPVGLFGASTGAAAALVAASALPGDVAAIVSRGGRPDLAGAHLDIVRAPTLLIVGGADDVVLGLNRIALQRLNCVKELRIVPGATHLFEEPGALEQVVEAATSWFRAQMGGPADEQS